jgi:hypothetical protein
MEPERSWHLCISKVSPGHINSHIPVAFDKAILVLARWRCSVNLGFFLMDPFCCFTFYQFRVKVGVECLWDGTSIDFKCFKGGDDVVMGVISYRISSGTLLRDRLT